MALFRGTFLILAFFFCVGAFAQAVQEPPQAINAMPPSGQVQEVVREWDWIPLRKYKPIYLISGTPNTKIQLSFQTSIVRGFDLFFGYSQLMIWDSFKTSSPIRDVDFNPEFFYRIGLGTSDWLFIGLYEHESNGRDGDASRSWDKSYLRYQKIFAFNPIQGLDTSFKIFVPYRIDEPNSNITWYRGIWEAQVRLYGIFGRSFDIDDVTLRFYPGGKSNINPLQGGQELTFRTKYSERSLLLPVVFQIFHGYGEDLLDYNVTRWGVRAGFGL